MFCYNILKMKRKIRPVPPGLTQGAAFIRGWRLLILCRSRGAAFIRGKIPHNPSVFSEIQRVVPKSHCGRDLVKQTAHGILGNSCLRGRNQRWRKLRVSRLSPHAQKSRRLSIQNTFWMKFPIFGNPKS